MPLARLERALPKKTDFESVASTNSATGAPVGFARGGASGGASCLSGRGESTTHYARRAGLPWLGFRFIRHDPDWMQHPMSEAAQERGLISALEEIARDAPEDGLSLGDFVDALGERAFGVMLFALALPVSIPFLYGVPQLMSLPMMALSAQMVMGREEPWLPARFKRRMIARASLQQMARGGRRWFGWLEALARPRLLVFSHAAAERVIGAVFTVFCASIMVPLPATNTTPGIALAIAALGLLTRDGILILLGLILGTAWITLLLVLGSALVDIIKDYILSLF